MGAFNFIHFQGPTILTHTFLTKYTLKNIRSKYLNVTFMRCLNNRGIYQTWFIISYKRTCGIDYKRFLWKESKRDTIPYCKRKWSVWIHLLQSMNAVIFHADFRFCILASLKRTWKEWKCFPIWLIPIKSTGIRKCMIHYQ